jgi:hypothetical protein
MVGDLKRPQTNRCQTNGGAVRPTSRLRQHVMAALLAALFTGLAPEAWAQEPTGEVVLERINRQSLDPGQCGLFLWSRGDNPTFVFVSYNEPSLARVRIDGQSRAIERERFSGESVLGHFERQVFEDSRVALTVDIKVDESRPIQDGAVVQAGTITARTRRGWETVTPVGGMIACERRREQPRLGR